MAETESFPQIRLMGVTGVLVRFADRLSEPANRAALAYRAAADAAGWDGVEESSTALASAFFRVDPVKSDPGEIAVRAESLLRSRDWLAEPLPSGRTLWRVPTAWGGELGPELADACAVAGVAEADAIAELSRAQVRVLALGFAPGQPYLGELPDRWDLPRRTELNPRVPAGALLLAIRQLVLFTAPAPTGWRHVGQTAFRLFDPDAEHPVPLSPGDEMVFEAADPAHVQAMLEAGDGSGGVRAEPLP